MQQHARAQPAGSGGPHCLHDGAALLAVLLEHPAVGGDQAVLCRLLASSRQVAHLVARHCAGRLDACVCLTSVEEADLAAAWLGPASGALTRLELGHVEPFSGDALEQLTALRHLELCFTTYYWPSDSAGLLAGLPHLTRLDCVDAWPAELPLGLLPASLEHLRISLQLQEDDEAVIDLGHLTRLTDLDLSNLQSCHEEIFEGYVLPPSLVRLTVGRMWSLEPMLRLTALRRLEADATPEEVVELARRLPALDDISIWRDAEYDDFVHLDVLPLVRACAGTPVCSFGCLWLGPDPGAMLQHISGLTRLTALELGCEYVAVAAGQLAAALGALQQLREVDLSNTSIGMGSGRGLRGQRQQQLAVLARRG